MAQVFAGLPPGIAALPDQWLGRWSSGCYATHSINERCDFSCTACYLAPTANRTPPLPFGEVCAQLDRIREHGGPLANVQITSGEVTLLPREQLARIVRYARRIGLDPIVMTHGQTFESQPGYLEHLVREGGLRKVCIHIDSTQRGRRGVSSRPTEAELMAVRDRFAAHIRSVRRKTKCSLVAAHTVSVTDQNAAEIPAIVRWVADNADVFRLVSFLPVASVGRTRSVSRGRADATWDRIEEGVGRPIGERTFTMGHPSCSRVALLFVVSSGGRASAFIELKRPGSVLDVAWFRALRDGAARAWYFDGTSLPELVGRGVATLARTPSYLWQWPAYVAYRAGSERAAIASVARSVLCREDWAVQPLVVIVHDFMNGEELETPLGRERLAACAFRAPADGRMVPMCELNGTELRERQNRTHQRRAAERERRGPPLPVLTGC